MNASKPIAEKRTLPRNYRELSDTELNREVALRMGFFKRDGNGSYMLKKHAPSCGWATDLNYAPTLPLPALCGFQLFQVPKISSLDPFVMVHIAQIGIAVPLIVESPHGWDKAARGVVIAWLRFGDEQSKKSAHAEISKDGSNGNSPSSR